MTIHRALLAFAVILPIVGCASGDGAPTPAASVAIAETALTAAERLASVYADLPRCTPFTGSICRDPKVTVQLKALDERAYRAVKAARAATREDPHASRSQTSALLADAKTAVAALSAAVAPLNK